MGQLLGNSRQPVYLLGIAALLLSLLLHPLTASAHANLASSKPLADAQLDTAPSEIRITFTEGIDAKLSSMTLWDEDGREIGGAVSGEGDDTLVKALPELKNGIYKVKWQVLSVDTHVTEGSYRFAVGTTLDKSGPAPTKSLDDDEEPHPKPDNGSPGEDGKPASVKPGTPAEGATPPDRSGPKPSAGQAEQPKPPAEKPAGGEADAGASGASKPGTPQAAADQAKEPKAQPTAPASSGSGSGAPGEAAASPAEEPGGADPAKGEQAPSVQAPTEEAEPLDGQESGSREGNAASLKPSDPPGAERDQGSAADGEEASAPGGQDVRSADGAAPEADHAHLHHDHASGHTAHSTGMTDRWNTVIRIVNVLTTAALFALLYHHYAVGRGGPRLADMAARTHKAAQAVALAAAFLYALTYAAHMLLLAAQLTPAGSGASSMVSTAWTLAVSTRVGLADGLRIVLAAGLWGTLLAGQRAPHWPMAVLRCLLLLGLALTFPLTGHAVSGSPLQAAAAVVSHALHFATAGIWFGGLAGLLLVTRSLRRKPDADAFTEAGGLWSRFSAAALPLTVITVLTGLVLAVMHVGSWEGLYTSAYGQTLLVKSALYAGVLVIAAFHRFLWLPAFVKQEGDPERVRVFLRGVSLEAACGAAIFIIAGMLSTGMPPGLG
ncbi:copper resistance protein CopC [Paenibacillus dendritiformis C454]|uniref:Copper resistance protein CopC n=1 Tax=Paenibacillus dendritiformis C454 TaxID=1131935 RepID=H3SN82_9BACL|nr:copper resistance protein CopC [Paenibacillus dendritiformis]EHQ59469.1 copper resistance protein CopC [Paenibacillus dendritiformis C454]